MNEVYDFSIKKLGEAKIPNPIKMSKIMGDNIANYVNDDELIFYNVDVVTGQEQPSVDLSNALEKAGPREHIYFNPSHVHAAIVTCGGLCPGLNDVIRSIVRSLWYRYGVRRITGIRNGYRGFLAEYGLPTMELDPEIVDDIHKKGGTLLGSSRGGSKVDEIVDAIQRMNISMLFTIGGDGTQSGALEISREIERRNLKVAVVGIPKTIDNDLSFIEKSFGFETAVAKAVEAVTGAHVEAHDAINGVGLVRVMGRESGFIAAHTSLASNDVNFCLIPESPFELDGENGLMKALERRLDSRNHAVILVAEGAGQHLLERSADTDLSGNARLGNIGLYLKDEIDAYFKSINKEVNIKYIDPSYIIRSAPAQATDSVYCARLGAHAVHAAMSGRSEMLISLVNNHFVHLPIKLAVQKRNQVDPEGSLWRDVLETTRQPVIMK
jgi:6-phosphofructokinase 1